MEIQFNERGRLIGCKLLNYLLEKRRVVKKKKNECNFNIFYILLFGASTEERTALSITTEANNYTYTRTNLSLLPVDEYIEQYEALKASMRHLGLGKRYFARIMQLIAAILHLGQLQFIDDTTMQQEAAFIKDKDTLELVSDLLGVDSNSLEDVLTYKTQLIRKDVTTLILDSKQASIQRDELATALYSLLLTWIVEHLNTRLCHENIHNFIGILDLPFGGNVTSSGDFDRFCLNYANERIQNYISRYIFETSGSEYQQDGLEYPSVEYTGNSAIIDLYDQPRHGFIDILNNYSKKPAPSSLTINQGVRTEDMMMLETTTKYQTGSDTFQLKKADTGASYFAIQHFNNVEQSYEPNGFVESNRDAFNGDFVSLFRGNSSDGMPASTNSFLVNLFESQHQDATHQQVVNRQPSMRRSKSLKKNSDEKGEEEDGKKKKVAFTVLSQLRSSLDEIFSTLDETMPWFVYCIKRSTGGSTAFDSQLVKSQVQAFNLSAITNRLKTGAFANIFLHEEFCERYQSILSSIGVEEHRYSKEKCRAAIDIFGWSDANAVIGNSKVM
jgi:chitin synthase